MAKGAYLLGERQRLLNRLGEEAFQRIKSGEWKGDSLEALVKQLERTTKKIEIEEKLIQNARFGVRAQAPEKAEPMESEASDEVSQPKPETKKEKGKPT